MAVWLINFICLDQIHSVRACIAAWLDIEGFGIEIGMYSHQNEYLKISSTRGQLAQVLLFKIAEI